MRTPVRLLAVAFAVAALACAQPKQAAVPEIEGDAAPDMGGEPAAAPAEESAEPAAGPAPAEDMRVKCCALCKEGLAKDKTGAKPETIPCADFTDTLSPWCLEHFREKPAMASECSS
jgi:hypothetical protein